MIRLPRKEKGDRYTRSLERKGQSAEAEKQPGKQSESILEISLERSLSDSRATSIGLLSGTPIDVCLPTDTAAAHNRAGAE